MAVGQPVFSEDTWLRLSLGEAYAAAGPWLASDPLLHTATGAPAPAAWLSDVALYGVRNAFGFSGLRVAHVLGVVAILVLAWSLLWRVSASPLLASLGTGLFAVLSAYRLFQLRPHLASIGIALLLVWLLVSDRRPPSWRRIVVAVALLALWANVHAGFVLGPVLLAAALMGAGLGAWMCGDATARTRAARIGVALVLGLLATLLNPEGITPHLLYLDAGSATPGLEVVVDEWLPLSLFALPPANLPPSVLSWALVWVLVVLTPWAAIGQLRAWRAGEGADPVLAALALVSLVGLLSAVRLLWLGIFPLLFLGDCARVQGLFAEGRRWGPALCTGFAVALLPGFVAFGDWPMISRGVQPTRYADPYPATKSYAHEVWFLRDAELEGRLFNSYEMGNFLGYWLAPRMRVFVNGSLNFPKEVMAARTQFERRLGATPGESFAESLDRFEIDVFFGTGLPVVSPPNRPSLHTTTHLENTPGWLPIFRTPRSALYLRNNARNRRNLERVVEYYATRGVPFSTDRGLDLERVAREAPVWAIENGVLPTHLSGLEAATRSLDPLRSRVARDRLATLFATLGLYERAIEIERKRLQAQPGSEALVRRLAWSLLHAGRLGEARTLLGGQAAGTDGWTALARSSSSPEALAAQVAVLPLLSAEQARSVLAGFREPAPRSLPR